MAKSRKTILQRYRVPLGFVFAGLFILVAKPTLVLLASGAILSVIGLFIRGWASGHIQKNKELAVSGPYAYTRNPLYFGSFLLGIGIMIGSGSWWIGLLFVILFLGIYLPVMSVESDELTAIFGDTYSQYAKSVPLFFPGFRRYAESDKKFEMSLYLRYREYRAAIGFAAIVLVLIAKSIFLR